MVAPPDYPWCYTCITRGCSSCDMMQRYPDPCTNCKIYFGNTNKKITCKRSGLTTEEWAEKKAIEAQKLQPNANPMFQFDQAQQGQAASFFPNMYQPQQWFGNMMDASDNSYPRQQQLPGSFPMSTPQLIAGAFGQKPSRNTLRAQLKRENNRQAKEEEMERALVDAQRRLDASERELARMRDDQRRVHRRIDDEVEDLRTSLRQEQEKSAGLKRDLKINRTLKHEAQKGQKDLRKQESIRGFESQLNDMRKGTPAGASEHGPPKNYNPTMGSTFPQSYYPTYGQQTYGGQQILYQMPYGYPPPMNYPTQPPMQGQPGGYGQPPPAGNMHHPMQPPVQYPTQPLMQGQPGGYNQPPPAGNMHHPIQPPMQYPTQPLIEPPPGGHQQSPPAGDEQPQGDHGVERRDFAQPAPGPMPAPTAVSSPVSMQQEMQTDSEMPTQPDVTIDASGPEREAKKRRAIEEAKARRDRRYRQLLDA
ncbi:hypothetical protein KC354_g3697 [Hortaea werneckii]|nr:hypothetical protein KC354_g3697 [Hortaea werneckii]